jgi:glycosyltransferase involved in cell wall biosynthesis
LGAITVLYLHATAVFGGASKSLCELLQAMPAGGVDPIVLCPPGSAADQFRRAGLRVVTTRGVSKWDHTRYGFYRGLRWLLLMRELMYVLSTWLALSRLRRSGMRIDLVHVNDVTVLLAGALARRMLATPLVVHVRSLQNDDLNLRRTRWQNSLLRSTAARIVAIDETVRRTLPGWLDVNVVHNGLRKVASEPPVAAAERRPFRVAIVGVLLRQKGVFEFVEAAKLCRERGLDAEFWIVGENVRDVRGLRGRLLSAFGFAEDVRGGLEAAIAQHGLRDSVKLLGFVQDVASIYRQIDVLCFPSHLDAAGRPVFEAAWFGVPSIVAVRDPLPDTIAHEQSGLCIPERDPQALADAIARLHGALEERRRLGQGARQLAEKYFDQERNSAQMLDIYRAAQAAAAHVAGPSSNDAAQGVGKLHVQRARRSEGR